jgi:hypothetical protein
MIEQLLSRTSTKKGPGRIHREPVQPSSRKKDLPRFWAGAKVARQAINKSITMRGGAHG